MIFFFFFLWVAKERAAIAREPGVVLLEMTLNRGCYLLASISDNKFFSHSLHLRERGMNQVLQRLLKEWF